MDAETAIKPARLGTWLGRMPSLLAPAGLAALISLVLEYGFVRPVLPATLLHAVQWLAVGLFIVWRASGLLRAARRADELRKHWFDYLLISVAVVTALLRAELARGSLLKAGTIYVGTMQVFLLAKVAIQFFVYQLAESKRRIHPARTMLLSFATVIVAGAALLALPRATNPVVAGEGVYFARHLLNCLFTATSATCVTGLIVYDTGQDFTLFGQVVILVLIQVGGLGTMIFGTVFGILAGRQISLRQSLVLQDTLSRETIGQIGRMVRFICAGTFAIEAAGTILLYDAWGPRIAPGAMRWYYSVFHAVSSFCNAGFALPHDNLVAYRGTWQVYGVVMPLIVLGGLGFPVLRDVWDHLRGALAAGYGRAVRLLGGPPRFERKRSAPWSLQSRIVLSASGLLIVLGGVLCFVTETPSALQKRFQQPPGGELRRPQVPDAMNSVGAGERALSALFLSVSARTAGFNTVRMNEESMSPATHFLLCVLMFVGGSPASTAGGAKTVTVSVLLLAALATLRRREQVEVFSRTIHWPLVRMAIALATVYAMLVTAVATLLCFTESASLGAILFEACSAAGTVGLSTGLTPQLTEIGRAVIILTMFAGRLGPLTVLVALAGQTRPVRYEYPTERLVLG